jgi:hypothetical protein
MAPVVRIKPNNPQLFLEQNTVTEMLYQTRWLNFICAFRGYNVEVARAFTQTFDGQKAKVEDIHFDVNEALISQATGLPLEGDRWFKKTRVKGASWQVFLVSKQTKYNIKGMPLVLFKKKLHSLLLLIKRFVTCEGRLGFIFYYHICFLMVFTSSCLKMPYYL